MCCCPGHTQSNGDGERLSLAEVPWPRLVLLGGSRSGQRGGCGLWGVPDPLAVPSAYTPCTAQGMIAPWNKAAAKERPNTIPELTSPAVHTEQTRSCPCAMHTWGPTEIF